MLPINHYVPSIGQSVEFSDLEGNAIRSQLDIEKMILCLS